MLVMALNAKFVVAVVIVFVSSLSDGLDNGLALTPPMGWLSWAKFECEVDCKHKPHDCISEKLYMSQADRMVADGFRDAGYVYVNIDDCYLAKSRDSKGELTWDAKRFPGGIRRLAKYMHDRGLKLGVYENYGKKTCAGYPAVWNHLKRDVETMVSWDIDMLKVTACYSDSKTLDTGYEMFGKLLNATGRPIVYSCSWPDFEEGSQQKEKNYDVITRYCNLWRNGDDVEISWQSILGIIDFYDANQDTFVPLAGPGRWNDPDELVVGNDNITVDQAKAQFAIWAIYAAPLLMSNDLRSLAKGHRKILLNKRIIAINQDRLGIMGRLVLNTTVGVYIRPVTPKVDDYFSYGIVLLNRKTEKVNFKLQLCQVNMTNPNGYQVEDLFTNEFHGALKPMDFVNAVVPPTGVVMLKATASL